MTLSVLDPRGRDLPFGMVSCAWLDRVLRIPGHRAHIKVAAALAARLGRRDRCAGPLSLQHLREASGIRHRSTLFRAIGELAAHGVIAQVPHSEDGSWHRYYDSEQAAKAGPGRRVLTRRTAMREAKIFRAHTDADWFRSAPPACVRAYLAHAYFGGKQRFEGGCGHGHFTGRTKLVAMSRLTPRAMQKWTRFMEGKALEITESTGRRTLTYWWLFPDAPSPHERLLAELTKLCTVLPPVSPPCEGGASFWVSSRKHQTARESSVAEVVQMLIDDPNQRIRVWRHESEGWIGALDVPEVVHGTRVALENILDLNPSR